MSGYADSEKIQYALKTALYRTMQTSMSDSASVERSAPLRVFPTNIMKVNIIEAGEGDIGENGLYVTGHTTAGQTADLSDPESTVKNYKIICPVNNVITSITISALVGYGSSTKAQVDALPTSGQTYPLKQWFFRGHYSGSGEAAFNAANVTYDGLQLAWNSTTNNTTPSESDIVPHLKYYLQVQTNYTGVSHSSSADNITYEHGLLKGLIGLDSNFVSTIMVTQGEGGPSSSASLGTSGSQAGDFWFTQSTAGIISFYGVTNKVDASTDLATFNTKFPMVSYVRYTGETGFGAGTGGGGSVTLASADSNVSNMIGGTAQTMTTTSFNFDANVIIDHYLAVASGYKLSFGNPGSSYAAIEGNTSNNGNLYFMTNGSYRMRITDAGNVGIGTTSPKSGLQVIHDQGLTISGTATTGVRTAVLRLGSPYTTDIHAIENYCAKITSTNNHTMNYGSDLRFFTHPNGQSYNGSTHQPTERMCILGNGNVGIGTTSPGYKLHVNTSSGWAAQFNGQDNDVQVYLAQKEFGLAIDSKAQSSSTAYIAKFTGSTNGTSIGNRPIMHIMNSGKVGIGTTTPTAKLHVDGIITTKGITNMRSIGSKFEVTPVTDGTHNLGNRPSLTGTGNWLEYHSDVDFDFILEMNSPYQVGMWVYLRDKQGNEIQRVHMGIAGSTTASSGTADPGYEGNNVALFVYNPDKKMYEFAYAEYWYNYGNNASDEAQFNSVIDGAVPTDMIVLNGTGYCSRWMEEVGNTERLRTHFGSTESPYSGGWSSTVFAGIKGYGKILEFDTSSRGVERAAAVKIGDINNDEFLDYQVLWTSNDIPNNKTEAQALDTNDFCFMYNKYGGRIAKMKISQVSNSDRTYINLNTVDGTTGGPGFSFDNNYAYFLPFYAKTAVENAGGTWPAGLDAPNAWQTMTWGNDFYWTGSDGKKYYFSLGNEHAGRRRFMSPGTRTRRDDAWPVGSTRGTNLEITDTHLTIKKRTDGYAYGNQTRMIEFKPFMSDRWNNSGKEYHPYTVKASINSGITPNQSNTETGFIAFHTADESVLDERMRIEHDGCIGIGTTTPPCGLQVGAEGEDSRISSMKFARFMGAGYRNHFPSGAYSGFSCDNHGTFVMGNNCHIKYDQEITITNTHTTMGGVGICMPGNSQTNQGSILFYTKLATSVTAGDVAYDVDNDDAALKIDGHKRLVQNCDDQYLHCWNRPSHSMWWAHIENNYFTFHRNGIGHCGRFYATANSRCLAFTEAVANNYTQYHTNHSSWDGKLLVGAGPMGNNPSTQNNWVAGHACVFATTKNLHLESGAGHTMYLNYYSAGDVHAAGAVRYSSDDRLKHNEKEVVNALDVINKLDVLTYFKSQKKYAENHNYELDNSGNPITDDKWCIETGLIAQKVKEIPELEYCVSYTDTIYEDDDYSDYFVDYNDIFCFNIAATQELDKKVIALETKNTELENEVATLKSELAAIKQHLGI